MIRTLRRLLQSTVFVTAAFCGTLTAAPVVQSVMNAASNLNPVLPNSALAPGAIFIVKGSGLGPANLMVAPRPFQTTELGGTSVSITVGGTKVDALMYYTSATQIAALAPSNTPLGGGDAAPATITVTYNGQSSPVTRFRGLAASVPGLFTLDSSGRGAAIATYPDYSLVSALRSASCGAPLTACGAANEGDTITLWATGLGGVNGSDASGAGLGQNMANLPLRVWFGGVEAQVIYKGRSGCCIGEDQIAFVVPRGVPDGCAVPLVVQVNNVVSNTVALPVASRGRNCAADDGSLDIAGLADAPSFSFGDIGVDKGLAQGGRPPEESAYFGFFRVVAKTGLTAFLPTLLDSIPPGTCAARDQSNRGNDNHFVAEFTALDAGSSMTITGPNGTANVAFNDGDSVPLGTGGTFLGPGVFTANGAGGKDIGAFTGSLTIPSLPSLSVSTSPTVIRGTALQVNWTGGAAGDVWVYFTSAPDANPNVRASVSCVAPASAGTLTIPGYVLLALPPNGRGDLFLGLSVSGTMSPVPGVIFTSFHGFFDRAELRNIPVR